MKIRIAGLWLVALWMSTTLVAAQRADPIQPITPVVFPDAPMIELGKKLYLDPRLANTNSKTRATT